MMGRVRRRLRSLLRAPGTTIFAALILGLGVAGTLAAASVVRAVLLEDLPYPAADRLVLVWRGSSDEPAARGALSPGDWLDVRERAGAFTDVAAVNSFRTTFQPDVGDPEQVDLGVVTGNFFDVLGVAPALGRGLRPEDDRPDGGAGELAALVLDHAFWQRRFGGDPGVLGRRVRFGGTDHVVVGVMPEGFRLLMPPDAGMTTDLQGWTPLSLDYAGQPRDGFYLQVLARLRPGLDTAAAGQELERIAAELRAEHPVHSDAGLRLRAAPMEDEAVAHVRPFLVILGIVGGVVLLVTCANVSALLLVRVMGRGTELAVRRALGAGRPRLVATLVADAGVIALAGTGLGILLAGPAVRAMLALQPGLVPRSDEVAVDGPLVLASLALAALLALACGLGPALAGSTAAPAAALRSGGSPGRGAGRLHRALVVLQVAAAFLLLFGTALLLVDLGRIARTDHGFEERGVLTFSVSLPFGAYRAPSSWVTFYGDLLERLRGHPAVAGAAAATAVPMSAEGTPEPWAPASAAGSESWGARRAIHHVVTSGHFEALGIQILAGRPILASDGPDDAMVAVVDETLAETLRRDGGEVLGRQIEVTRHGFDGGYRVERVPARVVGVAADVPWGHPDAEGPGTLYLALPQYPLWSMAVSVAGAAGALPDASVVREVLGGVDPSLPAVAVRPLAEATAETLAPTRFVLVLLAALALLVVALTLAGLYGVVAEVTRQRRRDLGVRLALGATAGSVARRVVAAALALAAMGVAPGLLLAPGLGAHLQNVLGMRSEGGGPALVGAALAVALVAVAASWVPARRAGRIDPVRVLRSD